MSTIRESVGLIARGTVSAWSVPLWGLSGLNQYGSSYAQKHVSWFWYVPAVLHRPKPSWWPTYLDRACGGRTLLWQSSELRALDRARGGLTVRGGLPIGRSLPPVSTSAISEDAAYTRGQGIGLELYLYSEACGGSGHINLHGGRRPPRPGKTMVRSLGTVENRGDREDRGLRDRK